MAQDAVAPRTRAPGFGQWVRAAALRVRKFELLPKSPALPPVDYNPGLVAYVAATAVAALALAAIVIVFRQDIHASLPPDAPTLAVGGVTIFLMSVYAIRSTGPAAINGRPASSSIWAWP